MAGPQTIWGIDIGRCTLKAVKLRLAADGKVELLAHDFIEYPKILSQPDANRDELIGEALEKFLSRNDLSKDAVVVSVPGQHTLARFTKLPPVAPKKIPDIVRYEADQQIPFDMDEVIWDFQTFQQEGLPDVEVGIFAMKRELIREHLLHFEQASIDPIAVQCSPLAVYNALHFDGQLSDDTTILLDIGAENTDLIIATKESLWTRTIAIGGNNFTDALVKSFKLSFSKAENLKRTASSSKYARQVFQAMRPVFADLVQELQRSIGFYSSTHRDAEIQKVIGVGNAFQLPGLQKYLQQNLGLPVERPSSFNKISAPDGSQFNEQLPGFAVPYGLAVQGLDLSKVTSNLLPAEIARQMVWHKKRPVFAAAAACLLLAGGLIWFRQTSDMNALQSSGRDSDRVAVGDVEQAVSIIDGGPSPSRGPRAQAREVLLAGKTVKGRLGELQGGGQEQLDETEELIRLQRNRTVVPRIIQVIHESVPRPSGLLGEARTQVGVLEAIAGGSIPRDEREQVHFESLDMQFEEDVNDVPDWGYNLIDVDEVDVILEGDDYIQPGFVVWITCRSPNKRASDFIHDTLMKNLKDNGRRPGTGFFFNRVFLTDGKLINAEGRSRSGGSRSRVRSGRRGGARAGGRTGAPSGAAGGSDEYNGTVAARMDPVTNEPTDGDWRFNIVMDVILEDLPETESEDEPGMEGGG